MKGKFLSGVKLVDISLKAVCIKRGNNQGPLEITIQ